MEVATFTCSICGESSRDICIYCTKDACGNHLCERCHRCSDCCACEMPVFSEHDETTRNLQSVTPQFTELAADEQAPAELPAQEEQPELQ